MTNRGDQRPQQHDWPRSAVEYTADHRNTMEYRDNSYRNYDGLSPKIRDICIPQIDVIASNHHYSTPDGLTNYRSSFNIGFPNALNNVTSFLSYDAGSMPVSPPPGHKQWPSYPVQGQWYPSQGQWYPGQGQWHPGQGQLYPGQGQLYPGQGQWYPGQGQWYPGQGQWYPGQGQLYPGQGQWYPGQGQWYPGHGQWYSGQGQWYPGQGQLYPGQGQWYPGQGQLYPGQGQWYPGQGQWYPGQGQWYLGQGQRPRQREPPVSSPNHIGPVVRSFDPPIRHPSGQDVALLFGGGTPQH